MSETNKAIDNPFLNGLWKQNPVFVQVLGMCPTLAITNSVRNAVAMGLATTFVLTGSNGMISLIRKLVPKQVRIATYIAVIATFVTIVDYLEEFHSLLNGGEGVLVLSREAGAWEELSEAALGVNPFDVAGTADTLHRALSMDPAERRARAGRLRSLVLGRTAADWLEEQLAAATLPLSR